MSSIYFSVLHDRRPKNSGGGQQGGALLGIVLPHRRALWITTPEPQRVLLRGRREELIRDLAELGGQPSGSVNLVVKTTLANKKTRRILRLLSTTLLLVSLK
jgi:hypothetical protein